MLLSNSGVELFEVQDAIKKSKAIAGRFFKFIILKVVKVVNRELFHVNSFIKQLAICFDGSTIFILFALSTPL